MSPPLTNVLAIGNLAGVQWACRLVRFSISNRIRGGAYSLLLLLTAFWHIVYITAASLRRFTTIPEAALYDKAAKAEKDKDNTKMALLAVASTDKDAWKTFAFKTHDKVPAEYSTGN